MSPYRSCVHKHSRVFAGNGVSSQRPPNPWDGLGSVDLLLKEESFCTSHRARMWSGTVCCILCSKPTFVTLTSADRLYRCSWFNCIAGHPVDHFRSLAPVQFCGSLQTPHNTRNSWNIVCRSCWWLDLVILKIFFNLDELMFLQSCHHTDVPPIVPIPAVVLPLKVSQYSCLRVGLSSSFHFQNPA